MVFAPAVSTALGLIFAVLTERVRWGTAFKLVVFMPMAISMLAAGIIFRLVYDQDPAKGVANAAWVSVHDTFAQSSAFPMAHPGRESPLVPQSGGFVTRAAVPAGHLVRGDPAARQGDRLPLVHRGPVGDAPALRAPPRLAAPASPR